MRHHRNSRGALKTQQITMAMGRDEPENRRTSRRSGYARDRHARHPDDAEEEKQQKQYATPSSFSLPSFHSFLPSFLPARPFLRTMPLTAVMRIRAHLRQLVTTARSRTGADRKLGRQSNLKERQGLLAATFLFFFFF